jgi:Carboxypeptidase regulatory-like domain
LLGQQRSVRIRSFQFLCSFLGFALNAMACSVAMCAGSGIEVRPNFVITVKHDGKPLAQAKIRVRKLGSEQPTERFEETNVAGQLKIVDLPAGDYWIDVEKLGIGAGSHCFHVRKRSSLRAKRHLSYDWGDYAPTTNRVAGLILDAHLGTEGNIIQRMTHPNDVPIAGAQIRLYEATSGKFVDLVSDEMGRFSFESLDRGTYVLHITGGKSRGYDETDFLINLDPNNPNNSLLFTLGPASMCSRAEHDLSMKVVL